MTMLTRTPARHNICSSQGGGARRFRTIPQAAPRPNLPTRTDVVRVRIPDLKWTIENVEGKRLSIAIFSQLAETYGGKLTKEAATEGLKLYGDEVVQDAQKRPGAHPNIDLLFQIIQEGSSLDLVVDKNN